MKTKLSLFRPLWLAVTGLVLNATLALAGDVPRLTPIPPGITGKWPEFTPGGALAIKVEGNYAYVADGEAGLQVIAATNPAAPVLVGTFPTGGTAVGVTVSNNRVYVATSENGLKVFGTLPQAKNILRVDGGTLGTPFTIESASSLSEPAAWSPIFTTNPPALPFEFTDLSAAQPQQFYRVRQP